MADFKEFIEIDLANKKEAGPHKINVEHIIEIEVIANAKYNSKLISNKTLQWDSLDTITLYF